MQFNLVQPESSSIKHAVYCIFDESSLPDFLNANAKTRVESLIAQQRLDLSVGAITPFYLDDDCYFVVGAGKADKFSENNLIKLTHALAQFCRHKETEVSVYMDNLTISSRSQSWVLHQFCKQWLLSLYEYDRTLSKPAKTVTTHTVNCLLTDIDDEKKQQVLQAQAIAHGANITKELGNLPANICTPSYLADQACQLASEYENLTAEVLEEAQMQAWGWGHYRVYLEGQANQVS